MIAKIKRTFKCLKKKKKKEDTLCMKVFSAPIHVSKSLQRGQNSPFINNHPAPIIGYPLTLRILLIPQTSRHLSLFLIVSRYITSICLKPCHDHLIKAMRSGGFKCETRLIQLVLHEIHF